MNISPEIKNQIPNTQSLFWLGSLISGILLGLTAPGFGTNWVGILAFFPLLAVLDQLHKNRLFSLQKRAGLFFAVCWFSGSIAASIGGNWIINSINIFGHIPWFAALLITAVGYGLEVGLQLFVYFGIPLLFIRQRSGWDLIVRLAFVLALDPWYPRLIQWNYGGLTFSKFPWLEQAADILGASGLLLYSAGFSFLLLYWWRWKSEGTGNRKSLFKVSTIYLILWVFGLGYGAWRTQDLVIQNSKLDSESSGNIQNLVSDFPAKLTVMVIQPNFSLQELASNPELAHSKRQQNLAGLLEDSLKALEQLPENTTTPKLLIWPESVYPDPFFKVAASREKVLSFAEANQTSILLATVDWVKTQTDYKFHGVSVLIGANGEVLGRYNKIFLIPFGETIPFSEWFPGIASWLRNNIANMSEFERGREYTVFSVPENIELSAPICFDIFSPTVVRGMVRNGSNLVVNLSNLAWFGRTTASDNMVAVLRWRAIENRVPVVFASNNGKSVFIGADGKNRSRQLGLFEEGSLTSTINIRPKFSFFREYAEWIWGGFMFLFFMLVILAQVRGKIFH
jgi:apolipoprotein N-acyltransferase